MYIKEITEARKNPELNPKESVNKQLQDLYDATTDTIPGSNIKNLFVSFTDLDKLGINPTSRYNTPIGIYAYPAEYVLEKIGEKQSTQLLPFAGDKPWVNIFRATGNVVYLDGIPSKDYPQYLKMLKDAFVSKTMSEDDFDHLFRQARAGTTHKTSSGILWYFTKLLADYVDQQTVDKTKPNTKTGAKSASVIWQSILRKTLNIDGMVDDGEGIIHENEPTQAVFFNPAAIEVVKRIPNKYNPITMKARVKRGEEKAEDLKMYLEMLRKHLNKNPSIESLNNFLLMRDERLIRYLSKETRIKLLNFNPRLINYLGRGISKEEYQTAVLKAPDILYSAQFNWSKYITPEEFLKIFQTYLEKNVNYFAPQDLISANNLRSLYARFASSPLREKLIYLILQFTPEAIINFIMISDKYPELGKMKYIDFALDRANSISPKRGQDLTKVIKTDLADVVQKLIKST
jgi:hypothetical protein